MGSLIGQGIVGVAVPALLALILNGLVLKVSVFGENRKWSLIGLIIVCCFVFSYGVVSGGLAFPPREAIHWLPYTAVGALLCGIVLQATNGVVQNVVRLVAVFAGAFTILESQIFGRWSPLFSVAWLAAVTLILFATSRLIERAGASRSTPTEMILGIALTVCFGGIALFLSGSAVLGHISGAFGLVLAGLAALTILMPPTRLGPILPLIYVLVFGNLLLSGSLFSDLPWISSGLLWIAPFGALIGGPTPSGAKNRIVRLLVRGLIVLFVIGLAFVALFLIAPPGNEY
jgi:hypothetical protein